MPWQTSYVEPEVFLKHRGVKVYHIYRRDDADQPVRTYWFTLDIGCGEESCACDRRPCRNVFDVRDLPNWSGSPHPPFLTGTDDTPENQRAWERYHACRFEEKHVKRLIRDAIDSGFLVRGRGIVNTPAPRKRGSS